MIVYVETNLRATLLKLLLHPNLRTRLPIVQPSPRDSSSFADPTLSPGARFSLFEALESRYVLFKGSSNRLKYIALSDPFPPLQQMLLGLPSSFPRSTIPIMDGLHFSVFLFQCSLHVKVCLPLPFHLLLFHVANHTGMHSLYIKRLFRYRTSN